MARRLDHRSVSIRCRFFLLVVKVKEVDLYSAFVVVPHTQGAQVRITQCYLQITCLYLVYQMAPPQSEVADI